MRRPSRPPAGGLWALVLLVLSLGLAACSGDSGEDDTEFERFVGTWALYEGGDFQAGVSWYVHFREDGTYAFSDNADGSGQRAQGTWNEGGGVLVGPFLYPGVGTGRVEATISEGALNLEFIGYWETPNEVVPYSGTRL